ncbi:hypothetical protein BA188_03340 [Aeromonas hydrophila]|nr:hypothetical protein OI72_12365 [Aeromonas hydrophila]OFC45114.1 hypothetical protein BA189_16830 [Aeromonas hydrophila]OFC49320.1 hypothetical protein BA188_03340 [Aeromonas hydrophila]
MPAVITTPIILPPWVAVVRELSAVSSHEYHFAMIGEVNDLLAIKGADVLGQANAPLLQSPLDAGLCAQ